MKLDQLIVIKLYFERKVSVFENWIWNPGSFSFTNLPQLIKNQPIIINF